MDARSAGSVYFQDRVRFPDPIFFVMTHRRPSLPTVALWVAWLLAMTLLARRVWQAPAGPQLAQAATEGETWLAVSLAEARVGTVHVAREREVRSAPGMHTTLDARLDLPVLGQTADLRIRGSMWQAESGDDAELSFALEAESYDVTFDGTLEHGRLRGTVTTGAQVTPIDMAVDRQLLLGAGFGPALVLPTLAVGETATIQSFDPLTLRPEPARLRCVARETLDIGDRRIETAVVEIDASTLRARAWVDLSGQVVRAEMPLGLVLERIEPPTDDGPTPATESVLDPTSATADLLAASAIHPQGERPFRGATRMTVSVHGVDPAQLPQDDHQRRQPDGSLRVRGNAPTGATVGSTSTAMHAEHLASEPFVESDHPAIRSRAAEIVGDETDPWRRALAIHEWVFTHLDKAPAIQLPSAVEVLATLRGDCNEHTVLYTALARAAGIPTRMAIGIVWSDAYDGFYYHAWPEVYAAGWRRLDPTLGQTAADATHVKLLSGGIAEWPRLLAFLGQIELTVLDIE